MSSTLSDVEKKSLHSTAYVPKPSKNGGDIARKVRGWAAPG